MAQVEWAAWVQAFGAILAILLAPQSFRLAWDVIRVQFRADCEADGPLHRGGAKRWTVTFTNRSRRLRAFRTTIYPAREGNMIGFARVATENDGGFHVESAVLEHGALVLNVDRIAPLRRFKVEVAFEGEDQPTFAMQDGRIRKEVIVRRPTGRLLPGSTILVSHTRLMIMLLQFIAAATIIIARLFALGFEK